MATSNLPRIELTRGDVDAFERSAEKEWLVTNGIGGFASGTAANACTRRYHGLLVAALKPPVERTVMVAKLEAFADYDGRRFSLTSSEYGDGTVDPRGYSHLERFGIEGTLPIWQYVLGDARVQQRVAMVHGENTTVVSFTLERASSPLRLELRPLCTYRDYHSHTHGSGWNLQVDPYSVGCEIRAFDGARPYRLFIDRGSFEAEAGWYWNYRHRAESARGLDDREDLFSPGTFVAELSAGDTVTLTLTAEPETQAGALAVSRERSRQAGLLDAIATSQPQWVQSLALAADQFIVTRTGAGESAKSIIAGYPWFSDWGRDTMIALPGLTLAMGQLDIAADILRTFARFVSEGMLPNRFPDAGEAPEYNTVDATLWYFEAVQQYFEHSGDRALIASLYPILSDIIDWHLRGTRYGIHVDRDGLLFAGESGVQLTWMDAKVGDWVVTPRIGKPVEVNALWYRALLVMKALGSALGDRTAERRFATLASGVAKAFRERYWLPDHGYLADVIDGPGGTDTSLRPNQIFAVSLDGSLLERDRQRAVVDVCARKLWTPMGLRSLATDEAGYIGHYGGGPVERDAAYHQGTVWGWLLGPFALAHYRVYGNAGAARAWLDGIEGHLRQACIGSISEIFSGDEPHRPEGCFAQAWSVAEALRAWIEIQRIEAGNQQLKGEAAS
jgi:predicted glycogen debranching enzyme